MISELPLHVSITFLAAVGVSYLLFFKASNNNKAVRWISLLWLVTVGLLAIYGFFLVTDTIPPRMPLLLLPVVILMGILFSTSGGRSFIDSLDMKLMTWISVVRIPVELCLYWLFLAGEVPEIMTFTGRNWDILAGVTAPLVGYLYFYKKTLSNQLFMLWNVIGLLLLLNIIVHAVLSVPSPIQQFGFDQPNIGILQYPFVWLPSYVAPLVLFSHLVIIRRLRIEDQ